MTELFGVCAKCDAAAVVRINGTPYCEPHIDAGMAESLGPISAFRRAIENAGNPDRQRPQVTPTDDTPAAVPCPHTNAAWTIGGPGISDGYAICTDCGAALHDDIAHDGEVDE